MDPETFMEGLVTGANNKEFIKGEADVFSLVLEFIDKKAHSINAEGGKKLVTADIIKEIDIYLMNITKDTMVSDETMNGMKNAAKWFAKYFEGSTEIELNDIRYIYNGLEERFHILWMNCLD